MGAKRKIDRDQSLLCPHCKHRKNRAQRVMADPLSPPCLCGCAVVTDRKAFWLLLMLAADSSLNLPVGGGAQQVASICDVGSFKPTWTPYLVSFSPAFLTTLSLPLLRCWKATCCSSVCHSSTQSLASTCTISCLLLGPSGWRVSSRRREVPVSRETEGGTGKKNKKTKRGQWAGETEEGAGGKWDADFRSKQASFFFFFFCD